MSGAYHRVNWLLYDACARCGQAAGQPCRDTRYLAHVRELRHAHPERDFARRASSREAS